MTDTTARLALPLLVPGQAQKELFHNEALSLLDLAVQASVVAALVNVPPMAPMPGESWIVGPAPTGAWSGHAGDLAGWTGGGWRFLAPEEGMTAWVRADGVVARHVGGAWTIGAVVADRVIVAGQQVVGHRQPAIADPAGGVTTDAEARAAIGAVLAALRAHGLVAV